MSRHQRPTGPANLKSKTRCIEIRAQLQNPINMQLLLKKRSSWRLKKRILVAEGSCILVFFSFLFFSFLFVIFSFNIFFSRLFFLLNFWIWMLIFKIEAECKNLISSNYCLDCLNSRQILDFGLPVSILQWFS